MSEEKRKEQMELMKIQNHITVETVNYLRRRRNTGRKDMNMDLTVNTGQYIYGFDKDCLNEKFVETHYKVFARY